MRFARPAIHLALLVAVCLDGTSAFSQPQTPDAIPDNVRQDISTPAILTASNDHTLSEARKFELYREAAEVFLSRIKTSAHPEYLDSYTDFFLTPLKDHGNKPAGYVVYRDILDMSLADLKAKGVDLSKLTVFNAVAITAKAFYTEGGAKPAVAKP